MHKLLEYQDNWIKELANIAICEKARRIGLTWSDAGGSVLHAAMDKGNTTYQSYDHPMTAGYIRDCGDWAKEYNVVLSEVQEEEIIIDNENNQIRKYTVHLNNGRFIETLPGSARALRGKGKPGDRYRLDEAAFCDDLKAILKAAMAFTMWGGSIGIISTHNGVQSEFNELVQDVKGGVIKKAALHRITLDDAISQGLVKRIYQVRDVEYKGKSSDLEFRDEIFSAYTNEDTANEELLCIPSQRAGAWLPRSIIQEAQHEDAGKPENYKGGDIYIGIDIASKIDLWVAYVTEKIGDVFWTREVVVRRGFAFYEQYAEIDRLVEQYKPRKIAIDETAVGAPVVERVQRKHGKNRVDGVIFTSANRLGLATEIKDVFEDKRIRIPKADEKLILSSEEQERNHEIRLLVDDLNSMKSGVTRTGSPTLLSDTKATDGHSDRFWACALAVSAGSGPVGKIEFSQIERRNVRQTLGKFNQSSLPDHPHRRNRIAY